MISFLPVHLGQRCLSYLYCVAHNCSPLSIHSATTRLLISAMSLWQECKSFLISHLISGLSFSQLILHTLIRSIFFQKRYGHSHACLKPIFDSALPIDLNLFAGIQDLRNWGFLQEKSYWGKKVVLLVSGTRSRICTLQTAGYLLSSHSRTFWMIQEPHFF